MIEKNSPITENEAFFSFLEGWISGLPAIMPDQAIPDPARAAVISIDLINGFCYEGPLASPRVASIVDPIRRLFELSWERGVRSFVLLQDAHEPDAVEFGQWPVHCVRGTAEAQGVPALASLPFYTGMEKIEKNAINPALNTHFGEWVREHEQIDSYLVVGDCTDLCTYQLAMFMRLDANARQLRRRVIVPANCVDTYDLPVVAAQQISAFPHPGRLFHELFLYHMALNGVEVVSEILG